MSNRETSSPYRDLRPKSPPTPLAVVPEYPFLGPDLIQGALLVVTAELMFASMGVAIRVVSQEMPNAGIVFFRNLIGMSILLPLLLRTLRTGWSDFRTKVPQLHLLRGLAGLAAIAKVTVRRLSRTEPTTRIVFYFALTGTLVSALPLLRFWQTPSPQAIGWLLAVGFLATMGQLLLTRGFSLAPAARMGIFSFFSVLFGALYGWLFWDELISGSTAIGAALVVLAGINAGRDRSAYRTSIDVVADHPPPRRIRRY